MARVINIIKNNNSYSAEVAGLLKKELENAGFILPETYDKTAELNITIGGDGRLLKAIQEHNFPTIPFIGINTGHLGFFQEVDPDDIGFFVESYVRGDYTIQELSTVKATIQTETDEYVHRGLNEIVIRGAHVNHTTHLDICIGDSFMEKFSGDGVLISTPAGSTAYNYSLHGSIVDPRIRALQVTPISPMNTNAYRSFTSSMIVPMDIPIIITPRNYRDKRTLLITNDSCESYYENITEIRVELSSKTVNVLRFEGYDFWNKVMEKFL